MLIVLSVGTSSIVDEATHEPILSILSLIVETAVRLRRDGHRVVIVSSGAVGVGLQRMNMPKRPKHLAQVQVGNAAPRIRCMKSLKLLETCCLHRELGPCRHRSV